MTKVLPFRGLRFDPNVVGDLERVVCPPYDVIGAGEQAVLRARSPYNAVHLELPLDPPNGSSTRYQAARDTLASWRADGAVKQADPPAMYLHETIFSHQGRRLRRRDVLAGLAVEPWSPHSILPHEQTMAGPKLDRLELLRATRANVSPVWVLHREHHLPLEEAWAWAEKQAPTATVYLGDEFHHLWTLADPDALQSITRSFAAAGPLYIADGHHRYETCLAFRQEVGDALPGAAETLAVITNAEDPGLLILPTHRVLKGLPESLDQAQLLRVSASYFQSTPASGLDAAALEAELALRGAHWPAFGIVGPGNATPTILDPVDIHHLAGAMPADRSAAWSTLDVAVLHTLLIDPLLAEYGLARDDVLRYIRDPSEAMAAAANPGTVAFLLNATRVKQILDVADASDRMPEKSTYFSPKPPTGLVIRDLATP